MQKINQSKVYIIGKPYDEAVAKLAQKEFEIIGIFDKNRIPKKSDIRVYSKVISADFSTKQTLLNSLKDENINGALLCSYENYILAKSWISEYFGLPGVSVQSAELSTDKNLMRQSFHEYNPSITPDFALIENETDLKDFAKKHDFPLMLKPTNLVKSLLIFKCNDLTELKAKYQIIKNTIDEIYKKYDIHSRNPQIIIEEFIVGKQCSVAAFVDDNGEPHFCEGIVDITSATEVGFDDNFLYKREINIQPTTEIKEMIFKTAYEGIKALKLTSTPAHVELIYNDKQAKLIEIGSRIGGYRTRMYEISYGIDMILQEICIAQGKRPDMVSKFKGFCAVYEIFSKKKGVIKQIKNLPEASNAYYLKVKNEIGDAVGLSKDGFKAPVVAIVEDANISKWEEKKRQIEKIEIIT